MPHLHLAAREDGLQQRQNRPRGEMTAAEIAAREQIPIQEAEDLWPGSVSSETGEPSLKLERSVMHDSEGFI